LDGGWAHLTESKSGSTMAFDTTISIFEGSETVRLLRSLLTFLYCVCKDWQGMRIGAHIGFWGESRKERDH
jgi:hypothetical protein